MALILEATKKFYTNKIVIQGGDPLSSYNIEFFIDFFNIFNIKKDEEISKLEFCLYTGNDFEYIKNNFLSKIDNKYNILRYLKTGYFDENRFQKSGKDNLDFSLSSTNQEVYEVIKNEYKIISQNGKIEWRKNAASI